MTDPANTTKVYCPNCGGENRVTAKFCVRCGYRLVAEAPPVQEFYAQLSQLQMAMAGAFSWSELKDVAFELGIVDFASLPGETKEEKARELILRMVREDRLLRLVQLCREKRPHVPWPLIGPSDAPPAEKPLDAQYRAGIRHQLSGDLAAALQVFEGIQRIDPNFPGLQGKLSAVRYEMGRGYVDLAGRIVESRVYHPPPVAAPGSTGTIQPSPHSQPTPRARRIWPILIIALVLLLSLTVAILWLVSR